VYAPHHDDEELVRAAAAAGRLSKLYSTGAANVRAILYRIVDDVVYRRLTQPMERSRGHLRCAASADRMDQECHDRQQDNVATVLAYLLERGDRPIANIEAWLAPRLRAATVDAHRRDRGERGAQQRPRLPGWLRERLTTAWHQRLALEIMIWVGVPNSAGLGLWPLNAWADLREQITGEEGRTEAGVATDVEAVLAAMRTKRDWYDRYIERPLGRKSAPVLPAQRRADDSYDQEPPHLVPAQRHEVDDARLCHLAALAVDAVDERLSHGEDAEIAVVTVLRAVFSSGTGAGDLDRVPGTDPDDAEQVEHLLTDRAAIQRVTKAVVDIIRQRRPSP
jgi:hypothetical protein